MEVAIMDFKNRNVWTNMINFNDESMGLVDEGRGVVIISGDFSKAFLMVSHNILI